MKVSQRVPELQTQTVGLMLGWSQFTKGHNSVKTVNGVMVSAHHLMTLYIRTKFQENISKVSELLTGCGCLLKFSNGHNSVNSVGGVYGNSSVLIV